MKYLVIILVLFGCETQEEYTNRHRGLAPPPPRVSDAKRALLEEGYENIQETGMAFIGCSDDDSTLNSITFTADRVDGRGRTHHVEGVVCCGLVFKGCTIRH